MLQRCGTPGTIESSENYLYPQRWVFGIPFSRPARGNCGRSGFGFSWGRRRELLHGFVQLDLFFFQLLLQLRRAVLEDAQGLSSFVARGLRVLGNLTDSAAL
jgi:hypothetical protein